MVAGPLQIDLADGRCFDLAPWQSGVLPAGTAHRTRALCRTVNVTFERRGAPTVFADSGREGERSAGAGST